MSATFTHQGLPRGTKPFDLLDILHSTRSSLGLRDEDIAYLRYLLTRVRRSDCAKGHICAVWESPSTIAAGLNIEPRRLNRIENRLEDRGLIIRSFTSNRKRFGDRNAAGAITYACGINLGPLLNRANELVEFSRATARSLIRVKSQQDLVRGLVRQIRALGVEGALLAAKEVIPRLRAGEVTNEVKLNEVIAALEAVITDFSSSSGQTVQEAASDTSVRLKTNQEHIIITCTDNKKPLSRPMHTSPEQVRLLAAPEFRGAIELYADGSGQRQPLSWECLGKAARDMAAVRKVSGAEWVKACKQVGEKKAVLCFLVADRNAHRSGRFEATKIAGSFVNMVRQEGPDKSTLEPLLGELMRHWKESCDE
jgi:replication initiation protein RepC